MKFLPTSILTPDDWLVTITFDGGRQVVKGCSPQVTREHAINAVLKFVAPEQRQHVVEVTAMRRRDKLAIDHHPEVARRLAT